MKRSAGLLCAIGAIGLLASRTAFADDDPDQKKAAAEALFQSAQALAMNHNYAEACPKFAESVRLDPGLGAVLWLADCYENNGQTASAWARFREAAGMAAERQDPREAVAKRRAAALEPKLNRITVFLPQGEAVPGLEVRRDGVPVGNPEIGIAVPVNPGIHAVSASAPGRKPWSASIDVPAQRRDAVVVHIPELEIDDAPTPTTTADAPPVVVASPPALEPSAPPVVVEETRWSTTRIVGVSAAAVGLVGLGVGAILGLSASSALDASNANGHCVGNSCDATGTDKRNSALDLATGSTVAFIAGGALVAGGAALFFFGPAHRTSTGLRVTPAVSPSHAGMMLERRF